MRTLLCALALFALNLVLAWRVVRIEYTTQMWSIEGAYIGLARYINAHWGDLDWFSLWYGGIPFQDTYPPLTHYLAAAVTTFTSPAHAYHYVSALAYALGAVTLFLLVQALSGSRLVAMVAAAIFSCWSPSAFLMSSVRSDIHGVTHARRLMALAIFGEGPHILSLTLLPLALLALHTLLQKPTALRLALAALAYASVALTNWLGAFTLALGTLILVAIHFSPRALRWTAATAALAYALAGPWLPPSTIRLVRQNAQLVGGDYQLTAPGIAIFIVLVAVATAAAWHLRQRQALAFGIGFTLLTAGIALAKEWAKFAIFPQPERYHLAMEMGIAILLALAWQRAYRRLPVAFAVITVLALGYQANEYRQYARREIHPLDIRQTLEYQAGTWAAAHLEHQRLFATGSTGFWLNAFGDTQQFKGGFDQALPYRHRHGVNYAIPFIKANGPIAIKWLRAFGNHAVFVSGEQTRDAFHDWHDPHKFEGLLPVLWQQGDDRIYALPTPQPSFAHVVRPEEIVERTPDDFTTSTPIDAYVHAIDDPARPPAPLTWLNHHEFQIFTDVPSGQVLSIQINHHPGWHATSATGEILQTSADGLGFLLLRHPPAGPQRISFTFNGGAEMQALKLLQILALLTLAAFFVHQTVRQRQARSR